MFSRRWWWWFIPTHLLLASLAISFFGQTSHPKTVYLHYKDARPVLQALSEVLPAELRDRSDQELAQLWPEWVVSRDREIRARLAQGDEDSLINFVLFGTSFTRQPRLSLQEIAVLAPTGEHASSTTLVSRRIHDFLQALSRPTREERLSFAQDVLLKQKGLRLNSVQERQRATQYLQSTLERVLRENAGYSRLLEAARLQGNSTEEFAERSRLFRTRGLASDTSILPNFAIEESLKSIKERGLLKPWAIRRVAVIGPGLDFADKQEGYDFYPIQTIQPFAIIDTLLRLKLATLNNLQITTFDLSPRVNNHLARARRRAQLGSGYVVQLPRDLTASWRAEAITYWEQFGNQIGSRAIPVTVPATAGKLKIRAVRIRPKVVSSVFPLDTNIVLQRTELSPTEKFDLIIGTNIFVYYDNFDQSLAMMNIERMLSPGGWLLSNNALLELPFFRVGSVGYSTVVYSDRPDDGDHVVWYQRRFD